MIGVGVGELPGFVSGELGVGTCTVNASNLATSSVYRSRRVLKAVSVSVSGYVEVVDEVPARTGT